MSHKPNPRDAAEECVKNFKRVSQSEAQQRQREIEDLRFQVPEYQWTQEAVDARSGQRGGGGTPSIPPRPMLSISQLKQPLQLVWNQMRAAHLGVTVHPLTAKASTDVATVIKGVYFRIQADSNADNARFWAFHRATQCGRGYYRVHTEFDEEGFDSEDPATFFDQRIVIKRILHQETVYFDPSAEEPDLRDAQWAMVVKWVPVEEFRRLWPKANVGNAEASVFSEIAKAEPMWVKSDGETHAVRVAEYFVKHYETEELVAAAPDGNALTRERETATLWRYMVTGCEPTALEAAEWNGKHIPIIPVWGEELQPFDGQRWFVGMVGPNKDAQRFYNYAASNLAEDMAMETKAPYMVTPKQIEGFEPWWKQANTRNFPYLPYNPVNEAGTLVGAPTRVQVDTSKMQISMMALQEAKHFVQSGTGVFDPALGNLSQKERSGKAIQALQNQADASTSIYLQNLAQVSMPYEALVILDLIPAIYDRPGRVARTLDFEGNEKAVMLNAPFVLNQEGQPQRVPMAGMDGMTAEPQPKVYDLRRGVYSVTVTIGKSHQTLSQEASDELGQILSADPSLMMLLGSTYFKFRSFQGAQEIADLLKRLRDQKFPGIASDEKDEETPDRLKQERDALDQENAQLKQMLMTATQAIETDQVKTKGQLDKAQLDARKAVEVANINAQTKLQEQAMEGKLALLLQEMKNAIELLKIEAQSRQKVEELKHDKAMARVNFGRTEMDAMHADEREDMAMDREDERSEAERARAQADGDHGE